MSLAARLIVSYAESVHENHFVDIEIDGKTHSAILWNGDIWFKQKSLALIFNRTVAAISDVLKRSVDEENGFSQRNFPVKNQEGARSISRNMNYYNFNLVYAYAIRSNQFEILEEILVSVKEHGISKESYPVPNRKEIVFKELIFGLLENITPVIHQYKCGSYYLDFYLPEKKIVVEFDEFHHNKSNSIRRDKKRQAIIENELGARFIRIKEKQEIQGLNLLLKTIL